MTRKVIAIIASADTKAEEAEFLRTQITAFGCECLMVDVSTGPDYSSCWDITREMVAKQAGVTWDSCRGSSKDALLGIMAKGIPSVIKGLYDDGRIQGAISFGGLQNTIVGSAGLRALPIGIPKIMVSTVATGQRKFDLIMGTSDIMAMPAISDFAGLNAVSRAILTNAAAAITGMAVRAGAPLTTARQFTVGTTLMGATNDGVVQAAKLLRQKGYSVVSFHSTGIGGKSMEEMIRQGIIHAAMDLTLHEIVYEYFGHGFGYGADNRLCSGCQKGIPMVVCPGGIDFICLDKGAPFPDLEKRKYIWHNQSLAHVKLSVQEVTDISKIIVGRLNQAQGPVTVLFPLQGLRSFSRPGEALCDPEVDLAVRQVFQTELKKSIPVRYVDANFMDMEFSLAAAEEMDRLIQTVRREA